MEEFTVQGRNLSEFPLNACFFSPTTFKYPENSQNSAPYWVSNIFSSVYTSVLLTEKKCCTFPEGFWCVFSKMPVLCTNAKWGFLLIDHFNAQRAGRAHDALHHGFHGGILQHEAVVLSFDTGNLIHCPYRHHARYLMS